MTTTRGRRRARRSLLATLAALAMTGTACAAPVGTEATGTTAGGSPPSQEVAWTSCGERLECATVAVPLDRREPDGERIELAVIRHPASRPDERIGTIFLNPGGPGESGVALVRGAGDDLDGWGDGRFDLVSWDPRGTYGSSPVDCFTSDADETAFWQGVSIPTTPDASTDYQRRTEELARRCGEVMGPLLSHISTTDTARDLDALREAVGEETITYVGLSYGTFVGQVYANLFPDRVRAMLLDGIVDPVSFTTSAETRVAGDAGSADVVFERFLALCDEAGPERCALAGHGETAAERVERLFEQARQGPIPAAGADPPGDLLYSDLLASTFSPLRNPSTWPAYATMLDAAVDGDASQLASAAHQMRTPAAFAEATKSSAIACLDGPATQQSTEWPTVIGDLTERGPISGPVQGWWLWAPCASGWPASSDDRYTGPWDAETTNPILLVGTRYDPNTGYQNAVHVEQLLGNAVLLTHDGYGHLSYQDPSRCIEEARVRYLVDLVTPEPGTVCEADQRPFG